MAMDSAVLSALSSPRRQEILRLIWREEQTAGAIHRAMPDVTFGAVSLQLKGLLEAGLVEARAENRNRFYRPSGRRWVRWPKCWSACGTTRFGN